MNNEDLCRFLFKLIDRYAWISRYVEHKHYDTPHSVSTTVSLDISRYQLLSWLLGPGADVEDLKEEERLKASADDDELGADSAGDILIPILCMRKRDLFTSFDLRDKYDNALSLVPEDVGSLMGVGVLVGAVLEEQRQSNESGRVRNAKLNELMTDKEKPKSGSRALHRNSRILHLIQNHWIKERFLPDMCQLEGGAEPNKASSTSDMADSWDARHLKNALERWYEEQGVSKEASKLIDEYFEASIAFRFCMGLFYDHSLLWTRINPQLSRFGIIKFRHTQDQEIFSEKTVKDSTTIDLTLRYDMPPYAENYHFEISPPEGTRFYPVEQLNVKELEVSCKEAQADYRCAMDEKERAEKQVAEARRRRGKSGSKDEVKDALEKYDLFEKREQEAGLKALREQRDLKKVQEGSELSPFVLTQQTREYGMAGTSVEPRASSQSSHRSKGTGNNKRRLVRDKSVPIVPKGTFSPWSIKLWTTPMRHSSKQAHTVHRFPNRGDTSEKRYALKCRLAPEPGANTGGYVSLTTISWCYWILMLIFTGVSCWIAGLPPAEAGDVSSITTTKSIGDVVMTAFGIILPLLSLGLTVLNGNRRLGEEFYRRLRFACLVSIITDFVAAMLILIATLLNANIEVLPWGSGAIAAWIVFFGTAFGLFGAIAVAFVAVLPTAKGFRPNPSEIAELLVGVLVVMGLTFVMLKVTSSPEILYSAIAFAVTGLCFVKVMRWRGSVHKKHRDSEDTYSGIRKISILE